MPALKALAVALLYAAVMAYLTLLAVFFALSAVYVFTGAPVLLEVEKGQTVVLRPSLLLYTLAAATVPLYFWRGYTSYTRGNKGALLDPIVGLILVILAAGGVAIGGTVVTGFTCSASCPCGVKRWSGPKYSF